MFRVCLAFLTFIATKTKCQLLDSFFYGYDSEDYDITPVTARRSTMELIAIIPENDTTIAQVFFDETVAANFNETIAVVYNATSFNESTIAGVSLYNTTMSNDITRAGVFLNDTYETSFNDDTRVGEFLYNITRSNDATRSGLSMNETIAYSFKSTEITTQTSDSTTNTVMTTSQFLRAKGGSTSGGANDRYQYVVGLEYPTYWSVLGNPDRQCQGSLLNPRWTLTTTRCLIPPPNAIRYENSTTKANTTKEPLYSKVVKTFPHPNYFRTDGHLKNDIGLVLTHKVSLDSYGRVSAIDFRTLTGLEVLYVSVGRRKRHMDQAAVVPCERASPMARSRAHPIICVAQKCDKTNQTKTQSLPKPGEPLLLSDRIVGVAAGVRSNRPVFTAVSPFLDWIWTLRTRYDNFQAYGKTAKC